MWFSASLAALLYLDRVCISQSQSAISAELGLTKNAMGTIMSAFSLAYLIFEVPGGWLGDRIGPRAVITRIVVWWSAFTMATGLATGFWSMTTVRFMFGVGEAGCFPNLTKAFSNWFRGEDRTRAQSLMWLAARWGGALAPLSCGCARRHELASELLRLRRGRLLLGLVLLPWFRDRPADHPGGERAELALRPLPEEGNARSDVKVTWGKFLGSGSVWLLALQYLCLSYGFWFYVTWLPTYIKEAFHMKDADRYFAASLAGLPLFLAGISVYLTGKVTPWLVARVGSTAKVRRALGVIGHGIAFGMLLVSILFKDPLWAMLAMGVSCFGNDMAMPGSWTAVMDLGGRFAGTLGGFMNMIGMIGGLLAPYTIPRILEAAGNNWNVPIVVLASAYFIGALAWLGVDPVTRLDTE